MPEDMTNGVHAAIHHKVSFSRCNASYYEEDSISIILDNMKVDKLFYSVSEALIWLFEKETGKKLNVTHHYGEILSV